MGAICISYRPGDADDEARGLYLELVQRFGEGAVRLDTEATGGEAPLDRCSVVLTVIGRRWLYAANEKGQRRLVDPGDGVRREALTALSLDVPLVPVLVQGAHMPHAAQLPPELAELAFQNAVELTSARWSSDVSVLVRVLSRHVALASSFLGADEVTAAAGPPERRRRWLAPAAALALSLLGLGALVHAAKRGNEQVHTRVASLQRAPDGTGPVLIAAAPEAIAEPAPRPTASVTLFNYWNAARTDHLLSTSPHFTGVVDGAGKPRADYRLSAIEGNVFDPSKPPPSGTVPLLSWVSDDLRHNRATTDPGWHGEGHEHPVLLGHVYDPAGLQPPGTRPLFGWFSEARGDYFTTTQAHWCLPIGGVRCPSGRTSNGPSRDGYELVRLEGFVR
jgi:hypothetical protein